MSPAPERTSLAELAWLFVRLGATAFGGPAAHIAIMEDEVVKRRGWLSREAFLDLLGATNLIPGPNSTELALHIGRVRCGLAGLVVAGAAFIVPAALITLAIAVAYVRYGALPEAAWLLYGVKPVMVGIVVQALARLVPAAARSRLLSAVGAACVVLGILGANELAILAAGALAVLVSRRLWGGGAPALLATAPLAVAKLPASAAGLFWLFLKTGSVLFGSGYVLLAFLRADLVERLHWLSDAQLLDAIAVGQITPGPVFTTATFLGYVLAGPSGALAATAGIFLPAFVLVALSGPLIPRLRGSPIASALLDGVNVASLALMVVVTARLGLDAIVDVPTASILAASLAVSLRYELNASWLVLAGAAAGVLARLG